MKPRFRNKFFADYIGVSLPWVLLFLLIPGYMISFAPDEYAFMDRALLLKVSLLLTCLFTLISVLLLFVAGKLKIDKYYLGIIRYLLIWICLAGFLAPLVMKSGMVDPIATVINGVNLTIVFIVSTILTWMTYTKLKNIVLIFISIFILSTLVTNSRSIYGVFRSERMDGLTVLSKEQNVIILSFDGIPGNYASRAIKEFPILGAAFKDFIIYDNAVSASPSTALSVTTELHGSIDLTQIGSTQRELYSELNNTHLLLNNPAFNSYTYGVYSQFNTNKATAIPIGGLTGLPSKGAQLNEIFSFYDFVIVRVGTRHVLSFLNLFEHDLLNISKLLSKILGIKPSSDGDLEEKMKDHTGVAEWDLKNILTYNDYISMVSNLSADAILPCIRHMHFTFTHYPVDFDINCEYQSHNQDWHTNNQNHHGAYNETVGALFKLADFINKLKELNIYEQTFLVIKSDHGKPPAYYNEPPFNHKINGHPYWGIGRYMPMLMIKPENKTQEIPIILDQFVSLTDLAYTLSKKYMPEMVNDKVPGIDLLDLDEPTRSSSLEDIYLYVPGDPLASFAYEDLTSITVKRTKNLYESLKDHKSVSLEVREYTIQDFIERAIEEESSDELSLSRGSVLKFSEPSSLYATYGMAGTEHWGRWSNNETCGLKFYFSEASGHPSRIIFTGSGYVTAEHPVQQAEIILNGSNIGNMEFRYGEINLRDITIKLPDEILLFDKSNTLEFHIKDPISPKSLGLGNDARKLGIGFRSINFK